MNKDIIFKLSEHMQHGILNTPLQTIMGCSIDDVIGSHNKSKLWTAIALSTFELEKRSKAQNVGNWTGYQKFKLQFHIQISKFLQVRNLRLPFHCIVTLLIVSWSCPYKLCLMIRIRIETIIYVSLSCCDIIDSRIWDLEITQVWFLRTMLLNFTTLCFPIHMFYVW